MEELIGLNFGKFLPLDIKQILKKKFDLIVNIISNYPLVNPNFIEINENLSNLNIDAQVVNGGKDTYYLVEFKIEEYHFLLKLTKWTNYQLWYYVLSIFDFENKINDTITIPNNGMIKIELANTLAFCRTKLKGKTLTILIQEFNEATNYVEFTRQLAERRETIPVNLVKTTWKFLHENGFVIDYMPKNFHITFNNSKNIYLLTYLDFIHSNDPTVREDAKIHAQNFENDKLSYKNVELI